MILRARILLPISRPPIENGAIQISGGRIRAVGSWRELRPSAGDPVCDLGDVILLPGLINAHCHLDYTDMAGQLPPPKNFTDWIGQITAAKDGWNHSDYARSWQRGAHMLLHSGTTTVGDIEARPELLPESWDATPLRVVSFLEMTGVRAGRAPREILEETAATLSGLSHSRCSAGLSPHAPYSTPPGLLRLSAALARKKKWRLCTHLSESAEEFEMFQNASGGMFDWLQRHRRDMSDCGLGSPVKHAARHGLLSENLLAVHLNYLARGDAALLGRHRVSIVHCPRSHDYFRHAAFPRARLAGAGSNLCLGTDSLASQRRYGKQKPELNLFEEMRQLAASDRSISPREILRMATLQGARALGLAGRTGELSNNTAADVIAIPAGTVLSNPYDTVLAHTGPVLASLIGGRWAISPAL